MDASKLTGKVKFFKKESGFGFITNNSDGKDIFFHVTKVVGMEPAQGNDVEYQIGEGKDGKGPAAINVTIV